jgi:uncharacterized protein YbjT (DUF2867 family)
MARPVILLGLGFTTRRVARRLLARRVPTFAAVRRAERFQDLAALGLRIGGLTAEGLPRGAVLIHTIPPLPEAESLAIRELILQFEPKRVVYISSTGVYGGQSVVDENTAVLDSDDKARQRIADEDWLRAGSWETLIVRPAAIYGPGRGVHIRIREGRLPRAEPGGITSRIHADDLAAIVEAGARSGLTGAWPAADDYPCATAEIAAWCAELFRLELKSHWKETIPVWGRRVHGGEIRKLLSVDLAYPKFDAGILACLCEERLAALRSGECNR